MSYCKETVDSKLYGGEDMRRSVGHLDRDCENSLETNLKTNFRKSGSAIQLNDWKKESR